MPKIVINTCHGGYSLSEKAYAYLGIPWDGYGYAFDDDRTNPLLVKCVEELREEASGKLADLKVVDVPDDIKWKMTYYDGVEEIHEEHQSWS